MKEKGFLKRKDTADLGRAFKKIIWSHYKKHGRDLPWRKTKDPYRILISELMLQQTQVDRVIPFYKNFLKEFPTPRALAQSPLARVLRAWQGLGYNRRAKYLHNAAKQIVAKHGGKVPQAYEDLRELPGVGDYTAKAVRAFAFNEPSVLIETNIRSVFIHHFFSKRKKVSDTELYPYIEMTVDIKNPREWYWALMDYGAFLKKTEGNVSRKSAHHVRQKPFKGSDREIRGAILRTLSERARANRDVLSLPFDKKRIRQQVAALVREKLIVIQKGGYALG